MDDEGLTFLELVILIAVFFSVTANLRVHLGGGDTTGWGRTFSWGLVAESMYVSGDNLQPFGNVYEFPSISRTSEKNPVIVLQEDPGRFGGCPAGCIAFHG